MSRRKPIGPEDHPDWGKEPMEAMSLDDVPPEIREIMMAHHGMHHEMYVAIKRMSTALFALYIPSVLLHAILFWNHWLGVVCGIVASAIVMVASFRLLRIATAVHNMPLLTAIRRDDV